MGLGDQLMAAGLAETEYRRDPTAGPVAIRARDGKLRWSSLWDHNPALTFDADARFITCGAGALPYLQYPKPDGRFVFSTTYRARDHRTRIYLTEAELAWARDLTIALPPFVLIEPTPRDRQNSNRCWPLHQWNRLVTLLGSHGIPVYTFDHPHAARLTGVPALDSPTFRHACALMTRATLVISLEGGIPFATAALGVSTIVLWGGCISAPVLSYPEHHNLVDTHADTPCGWHRPCAHCEHAWARLQPTAVADLVRMQWRARGLASMGGGIRG